MNYTKRGCFKMKIDTSLFDESDELYYDPALRAWVRNPYWILLLSAKRYIGESNFLKNRSWTYL